MNPLLFETPRRPRSKPRRLMRLCDAGEPGLHMRCHRCGHDGGWWSENADRLGVPCPFCDGSEPPAGVVLQMVEYCRCDACRAARERPEPTP